MDIDVSRSARTYIQKKGGNAYVFFGDAGRWMTQRVATREPRGIDFEAFDAGSVRIWLQSGFLPPKKLTVRRRPWPLGPLEVRGTGVGSDAAGGGGDDGRGPPHWPGGDGGGGHGGGGHGHGDFGGGHGGH